MNNHRCYLKEHIILNNYNTLNILLHRSYGSLYIIVKMIHKDTIYGYMVYDYMVILLYGYMVIWLLRLNIE